MPRRDFEPFPPPVNPKFRRGEPLPVPTMEDLKKRWQEQAEARVPNELIGPIAYDIKPQVHQKHLDYYGYHHYRFFNEEQHLFPFEVWSSIRVSSRWRTGRGGIGGNMRRMRYEFHQPAKVGKILIGTVRGEDTYMHRGRPCYTDGINETRDLDGFLIFRGSHDTISYSHDVVESPTSQEFGSIERQRRGEKGWWTGVKEGKVPRATKNVDVGQVLLAVVRPPMPMRVSGYREGGWDEKLWPFSVHNPEWAQKAGYEGGLTEANMVMENGLLTIMCDFFGPENFMSTGLWEVKCTGPVYVNDVLTGKTRVKAKELLPDGSMRITLDARIEKDEKLVQVGIAAATIPANW